MEDRTGAGQAVSVIVPTYRRPLKLRRVVEGVLAQLGPEDQLVVVDDGSGDETPVVLAAVADPRLKAVTQPNTGVSGARNRGAAESTGGLLVFLDDDEIPDDGWLDAHRRMHGGGARRAVAGVSILVVRSGRGIREIEPSAVEGPTEIIVNDSFSLSRSDFEAVGGFDVRFRHGGEDVELGIRLKRAGVDLVVCPAARVRHEIDRGYVEFRRQRFRRGAASAMLRRIHGIGILPAPSSLRGFDRLLGLAARNRPAAEVAGLLFWLVVLAARRAGMWPLEASAAGRVTLVFGLLAERREARA